MRLHRFFAVRGTGGHRPEHSARQSGAGAGTVHPNPTASLELEDVAGSGEFDGVDSAQTTLLLGQLIELGGKRAARVDLASADRDLRRAS
jgi:cobalt-zinc-cadmium efflux system outer membrane protein